MTHNERSRSPILSICIPTFNRAHLLESALYSLAPQVKTRNSDVEVIVSDNDSTDDTPSVVRRAQTMMPIRYYRNTKNVGIARNILRLTNELARGEFAWVLGDDDLVLPGGLGRVIQVLERHREIDYVFVNLAMLPYDRLPRFFPFSTADLPSPSSLPSKAKYLRDRYVERWEELIDPDVDEVFLGSCMVSVFRLARWKAYSLQAHLGGSVWASLEEAYLMPVILAHTMIGRRAFYIGQPCVVSIQGGQEWLDQLPVILTVRIQELLDFYLQLGIDAQRVERCRRVSLDYSAWAVQRLLANPNTPGRQYFSLRRFIWRNRHHPTKLVSILFPLVSSRLPHPVRAILNRIGSPLSHFLDR